MAFVPCPKCGAKFDVTSFTPGKKLRCSKCKEIFAVPGTQEAVPQAAVKQEARTSVKKSSSSSRMTPRPADDSPAPAGEKKPTRTFPKPSSKTVRPSSPKIDAEAPPEESAPKGKAKFAIIGLIVLLAGAGAYFWSPGDEAAAGPETY